MGFGNPVPGTILENKAPWPGPPQFRVTSTFAQHVASGRGAGIDIGNQRCGSPVLAMDDGTVTFVGQLSTAIGMANVVRYRVSATEEFGAAHLATMTVVKGQLLLRGQQIGTLGMTGADACHLHQGYKVNGVEKDWWPLLDQNGGEMPPPGTKQAGDPIGTFTFVGTHALISTSIVDAAGNLKLYVQAANAGPFEVLAVLDLKNGAGKPIDINGKSPPLNARDQVYLVDAPAFGNAAYALRQDGTFIPFRSQGYTQAELDDAVDKAEVDAGKAAAGAVAASAVTEANKYR